jgi:hypothetical protein
MHGVGDPPSHLPFSSPFPATGVIP